MIKLSFKSIPRVLRKTSKAFLTIALFLCCTTAVVGQEPASSPTPMSATSVVEQSIQVPPIASDFRSKPKPLPELGRVGVDMEQQRPLSLRDALTAALENNKDIEVARHNVKIAEFDLQG